MTHQTNLAQALDSARRERERLNTFIQVAEGYVAEGYFGSKGQTTNRFKDMSAASATKIILNEHREPLRIKTILGILSKGGYSNPKYCSLYATLTRGKAFCKFDKSTFGLAAWKEMTRGTP